MSQGMFDADPLAQFSPSFWGGLARSSLLKKDLIVMNGDTATGFARRALFPE